MSHTPRLWDGDENAVPAAAAVDSDTSLADKLVVAAQPAATHLSQKLAPGGGGGGCWLGGPRTASTEKWTRDPTPGGRGVNSAYRDSGPKQPEFSPFGKNLFGDDIQQRVGPLATRFTFPPFTVLSARDGDWQDRKRAWLALGIQSELGRGGMTRNDGFADATALMRGEYIRKTDSADTYGAMKKQYSGEGGNLPFADKR